MRQFFRAYRSKWWVILLCTPALILAMTSILLFVPLSAQIGQTDIIREEDYLTVAVPDFAHVARSGAYQFGMILQNGGVEQLTSVKQIDHRTAIYAHSSGLKPVTVLEHDHKNEDDFGSAAVMPSSFFVGTIVCGHREQTVEEVNSQLTMYRNQYEARIDQPITLCEDYADIRNITVFVDHYEAELMKSGKTYLVWGMLVVDENNRAELHMRDHAVSLPVGIYREEKNGSHWKMQDGNDDFVFPWISEINGSLDDFWNTELGRQWQEDILAKGEISLHSTWLIGTDCLQSILSFNRGTAYITQGTTIDGAASPYVCLISEELAERNALAVGDELVLDMYANGNQYIVFNGNSANVEYDNTYVPYQGFTEQHTYRIVGIYRTEDDIHDQHAVHPNTIVVPNSSLGGFYPPQMAGDTRIADSAFMVDIEHSLIIPAGAEELFLSEVNMLGIDPDAFVIGDNGYAADHARLGAADDALETVRVETKDALILWWSLPLLVLLTALFAIVWSAKSHVSTVYAVDTPNGRLLAYLYARQAVIIIVSGLISGVLAIQLRAPFALWWMSLFAPEAQIGILITHLPHVSILPVIGGVLVLALLAALPVAWLGARRKYHYVYHNIVEAKQGR
ncbi:MAG: hypothetical protein IJW99_12590 [Clostridia bacterium]|nr:hypothetical protein [Clostridia bacterium]MBQ7322930.1 hypothetical protein [Clostridia bacterium]